MLEVDKPIRSIDITALRDNITALAEGASGAPHLAAIPIAGGTLSNQPVLDITQFDSTKYRDYRLVLRNIAPASDAVDLLLRFSVDGGASFIATGTYALAGSSINDGATETLRGTAVGTAITLSTVAGNAANEDLSGWVEIINPHDAAKRTRVASWLLGTNSAPNFIQDIRSGHRQAQEAVNAIRILFSSGNIASGEWEWYGRRRAA